MKPVECGDAPLFLEAISIGGEFYKANWREPGFLAGLLLEPGVEIGSGVLQLAQTGNGRYYRATADGAELDALLGEIDGLQEAQLQTRFETRYIERFQIFLALALGALILAEFIPDRKAGSREEARVTVERPTILSTRQVVSSEQ